MHATVTAFLERLAADDRTSRRTVAKQKNGQRAPNRAFAKALDHALSISMGFGLDRFLPFASVSALREYERRYFAFVELPGAEPRANTRRSCILDTRTKATRLELPVITRSGTPLVPNLFTRCDQGSIGWPRMLWLRCKVRLRGDCGLDRCHRYANDTKDACTLANLTLTRLEYALVCYVGVGPWEKNAFFWKIKCAAAEMFVVMDASFHMYQLLYEELCSDMCLRDPDLNTVEHREILWEQLKSSHMFSARGLQAQIGRWWAYEDKYMQIMEHRVLLLRVLLYYGLKFSWWSSTRELPCFKPLHITPIEVSDEVMLVADEGHANGVANADEEPTCVVDSNREFRRVRNDAKGTLRCVAEVLMNRYPRRLHRGTVLLVQPLREDFGTSLVMTKARDGSLQFLLDMCHGRSFCVKYEVLEVLRSSGFGKACQLAPPDDTDAHPLAVEEGRAVAENLYKHALHLLAFRSMSALWRQYCFPDAFASLISRDEACVRVALEKFDRWWTFLQHLEASAHADKDLEHFVSSLVWPLDQWAREVFVHFAAVSLRHVPYHINQDLHDYATSFNSTNIAEGIMNQVRSRTKKTQSKLHWADGSMACHRHASIAAGLGHASADSVEDSSTRRHIFSTTPHFPSECRRV